MTFLRCILSILLVLGLALGTTTLAAQMGMMAGMVSMPGKAAVAMDDSDRAGCQGCVSSRDTDNGIEMTSCDSGICIVLLGLLPNSQFSLFVAPDTFVSAVPTVSGGLSAPPDHRPPIHASLA